MTVASGQILDPHLAAKRDERRAAGVACGAHALHDGYTDLIYVMLPIWQKEFGLGYAELGLLRGLFSGTMASFQIPSGLIAERLGTSAVSLLLVVMPWRPALALLGVVGLLAAVAIVLLTPRYGAEPAAEKTATEGDGVARGARHRFAFPVLLSIGMLDSATRMGFLL